MDFLGIFCLLGYKITLTLAVFSYSGWVIKNMRIITEKECYQLTANGVGFCCFVGGVNFNSPDGLIMQAGDEYVHFTATEVKTHPKYFEMACVQGQESADLAKEYENGRIVRGKILSNQI